MVSTHSRLKAAGTSLTEFIGKSNVSTHSRLKAAGGALVVQGLRWRGFNTQPPKGGWDGRGGARLRSVGFNTQPPKGGWSQYPSSNRAA